MQLYYHKTDGGAEYLMDTFILCDNGHKEGVFDGAKYIVRIDGDIRKDAELFVNDDNCLSDWKDIDIATGELINRKYNKSF